jgi:hypothetical protein
VGVGGGVEGCSRRFPNVWAPKVNKAYNVDQLVLHLHGGWQLTVSVVVVTGCGGKFSDLRENMLVLAFMPVVRGGGGRGLGRFGGWS